MSDICEAFIKNPNINPRTGRYIKIGAATYNNLVEECRRLGIIVPTPSSAQPSSKILPPKPPSSKISSPKPPSSKISPPKPSFSKIPPPKPPSKLELIQSKFKNHTFEPYATKSLMDPNIYIEYYELPEIGGKITPEALAFIWTSKLIITNVHPHPAIYIMGYLMQQPLEYVDTVLFHLNLTGTLETDVKYNLLWYLHVAADPFRMGFSPTQLNFIASLSSDSLLEILGSKYSGPTDRASLLFAVFSGYQTPQPNVNTIPQYSEIKNYPAEGVWNITQNIYHIFNLEYNLITEWPPYVYLCLQDPTPYEKDYIEVNPENVSRLMTEYQIISGKPVPDPIEYFRHEISMYGYVLTREDSFPPPPPLDQVTNMEVLKFYTLQELINAYEVTRPWSGRKELIRLINSEKNQGPLWAFRHKYCKNDDTINIISYAKHGEIDKEDPDNPTLSYGTIYNYKCYQVDELIASWKYNSDRIFEFIIPDYVVGENKYFSLASIRQLYHLLETSPLEYNTPSINLLMETIREGLDASDQEAQLLINLKSKYRSMDSEQQSWVNIYLAWLFMFGFWMRFWNGPGYPWPVTLNQMKEQSGQKIISGMICPLKRNLYVSIQHKIRNIIHRNVDQDPIVANWIDNLPQFLTSTWLPDDWKVGSSLNIYLDSLEKGACQQGGGRYIPMTAYFLITRIIGKNINEFMDEYIPYVNELEKQGIEEKSHEPLTQEEIRLLNERSQRLEIPFTGQPQFIPGPMEEVPVAE